jgi:hypothetical protein
LVKAQIPFSRVGKDNIPILLKFVSQQSGFAFFGAATSVAALFDF